MTPNRNVQTRTIMVIRILERMRLPQKNAYKKQWIKPGTITTATNSIRKK
jgi:hypothetical protein